MLPGLNGLEVCRQLRQRALAAPIIMLSAKGEEIDRVVGIEIGADDYLTKPFSLRELLARIRARLRDRPTDTIEELTHYSFGDIELNFSELFARRRGQSLHLTPREYEILRLLVRCRGAVVSRDRLLNQVWGYQNYPTTRTVDNHIAKLRQKLEPDPSTPSYILSVYGQGYKFVG
jgi:two-component system alkaline phosphatase synthesis response regulator PhoP